jgi:hypothetical protein
MRIFARAKCFEARMADLGSDPLPDEPQSEATHSEAMQRGRVGPLGTGLFMLVVACIVGAVFYALVHDQNARQTSLAPGPRAAPLPDSPALTTTGQGVPLPGDRATGTVAGPDVKAAPPLLKPARPVIEDSGASAPAPTGKN